MPSVHAFILSWPGWEEAARDIAASLAGHVDHLTVFHKTDVATIETSPGDWLRIPSEDYYGAQFRRTLDLNRGDVMLHVQADARHDDWPWLASRCRNAFAMIADLGVWSPDVYHSWYTPRITQVSKLRGEEVVAVTATDGVVWALSSRVVEPMKRLDYEMNNLGWGLTEGAAAVATTHNLSVAMDLSLKVAHPQGSGYNRAEALRQQRAFLGQLSPAQRAYFDALTALGHLRGERRLKKFLQPAFWREKLRPYRLPRFQDHRQGSLSGHVVHAEPAPRMAAPKPEQRQPSPFGGPVAS